MVDIFTCHHHEEKGYTNLVNDGSGPLSVPVRSDS